MRQNVIAVLVVSACGGGGSTPADATRVDTPADVRLDAAPDGATDGSLDASPDGPADAMPIDGMFDAGPLAGMHHGYVLDSQQVPMNNTQARQMGFDLNNDGVVDNQFGMVLATLGSMGFDMQAATTRNIDRGLSISLLDVAADSFTTEPNAGVTIGVGTNPTPAACTGPTDTTCRHHLHGTGAFSPVMPFGPLRGATVAGTLDAGPGSAVIPFGMFADTAPTPITLIGARVQITAATTSSLGMVKIGGAIPQSEINTKVYPALRTGFQSIVARDCTALTSPPACGCPVNSTGATLLSLFEIQHDCAISLQEVQMNSLITSLFAPDVTINGTASLSYGYTATAVKATF